MKRGKKIGLAVACIVLLVAVIAAVNFGPMLLMKPLNTGEVENTGVLAISNRINNVFLVPTQNGYIAVDAGSNAAAVERGLAELEIPGEEVHTVLLTHTDSDHVAGLGLFPAAQVYMAGQELQMVNGTTKRNFLQRNTLPEEVMNNIQLLAEGQALTIDGSEIICVATPGHTPGSMSFLVDGEYLFTGDAIRIAGDALQIHPFTMDNDMAQQSLALLAGYKGQEVYLFSAHYGHLH